MNNRPAQLDTDDIPSFFHLYSDGIGIGAYNWRLGNFIPNVKSLTQKSVGVVGSVMSFFGSAEACTRYETLVSKNSFMEDKAGIDYSVTRSGCDKPVAEDLFNISKFQNFGFKIDIPQNATVANYIKIASYYYDQMQLSVGAGQTGNASLIASAKNYLQELEAQLLKIDADNEKANDQFWGALIGCGVGIGVLACVAIAVGKAWESRRNAALQQASVEQAQQQAQQQEIEMKAKQDDEEERKSSLSKHFS